jgi:hypothetical protein
VSAIAPRRLAVSHWRHFRVGPRHYAWRAGIRTQEWTIGVRYELDADAWLITFLCFAVVIGRR